MMTSFYNLLKYAQTGIASPDMTYYDKLRASTLMGGVVQTLTGQPPLSFKADGTPLISLSMKGNGSQTGTPTPTAPITPDFVGTLSDADWTIPITCAGQTVPVYLGQAQTVRKIRKLVFDGTENWQFFSDSTGQYGTWQFYCNNIASGAALSSAISNIAGYGATANNRSYHLYGCYLVTSGKGIAFQMAGSKDTLTDVTAWKSYLATQYAAGTPVTIWYVLAEPETAIVNEPLAKIGDYADELSSEDAGVTIPTVKGQNTLTVDTELQPSEMTITYRG